MKPDLMVFIQEIKLLKIKDQAYVKDLDEHKSIQTQDRSECEW